VGKKKDRRWRRDAIRAVKEAGEAVTLTTRALEQQAEISHALNERIGLLEKVIMDRPPLDYFQ
jgi:hypothetical protein